YESDGPELPLLKESCCDFGRGERIRVLSQPRTYLFARGHHMPPVMVFTQLQAVLSVPRADYDIGEELGAVCRTCAIAFSTIRDRCWRRQHFTTGALDVDTSRATFIGSFVIQGAVNHQKWGGLI